MFQSKKKMFSVSLAATLFAGVAIPVARGSNIDAAAQTFSDYSKVYYFTDRADGEDYLDDVIIPAASSEGIFSDSVFFYDWSGSYTSFSTNLHSYVDAENHNNVFDALVIFDVQKLTEPGGDFSYAPADMLEVFSAFKSNGCEIMLILGVDEMRLQTCNEFLDYVDFHVNTDAVFIFVNNLVRVIEEFMAENASYESEEFKNYSVCINSLADIDVRDWAMKDLIIPYLREKASLSDALEYDQVLKQCEELYNVYWNTNTSAVTDYIFALAFDVPDPSSIPQWGNMLAASNDINLAFGHLVGSVAWQEETGVYDGGIPTVLWDTVDAAVGDFIAGNDLSGYQNWPGRCEITYKPFSFSGESWLQYPTYRECWQIYSE